MTLKPRTAVLLALVWTFTACAKFSSSLSTSSLNPAFFSEGSSDLVPATDKVAGDCATNAAFDACVVLKNPVARSAAPVGATEINGVRDYGIKLRGLAATGNLENTHVQILTLHTPRFSLRNSSLFKMPATDDTSYAEQLMAYYWSERVFDYLSARVGTQRLPLTGVKIYVDDTFTGFASAGHSISLKKKSGEISHAFSAEILIQLLGQALAYELSNHNSFDLHNPAQHKFCSLNPKGCCTTELGCADALNGSFGDYLAGIMFPTNPKLGESVAQSTAGQDLCGLKRDLGALSTQTKTAVFNACAPTGRVALEGAWYASQWWKLRGQVEALEPGDGQDIDIIFFEHARAWTATTTFTEAKQAALTFAQTYKAGKYAPLLQNMFTAAAL